MTSAGRMERDYSSLLPDYDEAIAQSLKQAPPPSYSMAMSVNGHVVLSEEQGTAQANGETVNNTNTGAAEGQVATNNVITVDGDDHPNPPSYEGVTGTGVTTNDNTNTITTPAAQNTTTNTNGGISS